MKGWIKVLTRVSALTLGGTGLVGAAVVSNLTGLTTAIVDPPGHESINLALGNVPPKSFNLNPYKLVFQFEQNQGFQLSPNGESFDGLRLAPGPDGNGPALDIRWTGTQRTIGADTNFQTSASQFLWLGQATQPDPNIHTLTFQPAIYAAGFVLCRMQTGVNARVRFYADAAGSHLLQEYAATGANEDKGERPGIEVFVGYASPVYGLQRVDIVRSSAEGNLALPLYLDDLAVIISPNGRPQRFQPTPPAR